MNFQFTEATSHFYVLCGMQNANVFAFALHVCLGILSKMSAQMQTKQAQDYLKSRSTSMFSSTLMWEIPFMTFTIQITCDFCLEELKVTVHRKIKSLYLLTLISLQTGKLFCLHWAQWRIINVNYYSKIHHSSQTWCAKMYNARRYIFILGV